MLKPSAVRSETDDVSMEEYLTSLNRKKIGAFSIFQYANGAPSPIDDSSQEDIWTKVEVAVDSGACDTVMPASMCQGIFIMPSLASMRGMEYEVANGAALPNLGERKCEMITHGSLNMKPITFQVSDIHKPLLSISRASDLGYECTMSKNGGWLYNRESSDAIPLIGKVNLYAFGSWLRQAPLTGQGS